MGIFALRFISGKYTGGELPLPDEGEVMVGRSVDHTIALVEDMVSRNHAQVIAAGESLIIRDLGSTNGTFVNGERVTESKLELNDRILIGTNILKVISSDTSDVMSMEEAGASSLVERESSATTAMAGALSDVPVPDILQLMAANRKSGVVILKGDKTGKIFIQEGKLRSVQLGDDHSVSPLKALGRMVGWVEGSFSLEEYSAPSGRAKLVEMPVEAVLMEAMRQHDEFAELKADLPPYDSEITLSIPLMPKLSELNPAQLDILQHAVNFDEVGEIFDNAEQTDHAVAKALGDLIRLGYLECEF